MQPELRLGILGGGQLARMLAEAAEKLEVNTRVYVQSSRDSAAQVVDEFVKGSLKDESELRRFLETVDVVTFENEFVNCDLLQRASMGLDLRFVPSLDAIRQMQDKLKQKALLIKLGIRSAEYLEINPVDNDWKLAVKTFGGSAVLKWAQLGYDGKGTFFATHQTRDEDARTFLDEAQSKGVKVFAERKINFVRELAIQSAHSIDGSIVHYPLVVSEQERGVCRWVRGPARALDVAEILESQAQEAMKKVAKSLSIFGVFAMEFFEGKDGLLYVNELAPRVHNTGHYSIEAAKTSQFENHIRAILGENLGEIEHTPYFAMLNLLGPFELTKAVSGKAPVADDGVKTYWYGKGDIRAGRKMGHLTGWANSRDEFQKVLERMARVEQNWAESVKK